MESKVSANEEVAPRPTWIVAEVLDFLHWPLVLLLVMGWAIVPDKIWLGIMALVVASQSAVKGCPLIKLTNILRRKCDPTWERQGASLVARAFRPPARIEGFWPGRLVGFFIVFAILLLAAQVTQLIVKAPGFVFHIF